MKVLEGCKAFAEGLGEIEFKGSKTALISKKNVFLLYILSCILLFGGAKIPKTNRADGPTIKLFMFSYLYGCAWWHYNTHIISMVGK
jgi:hypothetical protein